MDKPHHARDFGRKLRQKIPRHAFCDFRGVPEFGTQKQKRLSGAHLAG